MPTEQHRRLAASLAGVAVFWAALIWWVVRVGVTLPAWPAPRDAVALCFLIALRYQFNVIFFLYADAGLKLSQEGASKNRIALLAFQGWVVIWCNLIVLFVERNLQMACGFAVVLVIAGSAFSVRISIASLRRVKADEDEELWFHDRQLQLVVFNGFLDLFLLTVLLGMIADKPEFTGIFGPWVAIAGVLVQGAILWSFGFQQFIDKTREVLLDEGLSVDTLPG